MNAELALHLLLVAAGALVVAGVSRRKGWPAPLLLVLAGLLVSPLAPEVTLDSDLVLLVFLPPLLFSAALDSSYLRLRDVKRSVALLSVGLVLFTMVVVGYTVHLLIPALPMPAAFALGAIIAPPDAVAAVAVGRRLGLPRRALTILVGESLFNDATALTAYRVALGAAAGATFSLLGAVGQFLYASVAGVLIGVALAVVTGWVLPRLRDPLVENTIMLLIPFGAYIAAELVHASGVISVVIVGLYLGSRMHRQGFGTRLVASGVWKIVDFVLETIVFALIGLQLTHVMPTDYSGWELTLYAVVIFLVTVAARFVWVLPVSLLQRDRPPIAHVVIVGWAGMRGVVSLAAAFAIPAAFTGADLVVFLTFTTVIGTLLVQGLTFPTLIRKLKVSSEQENFEDDLAEAAAKQAAIQAGLDILNERVPPDEEPDEITADVVGQLRQKTERRALTAWERLGGGTGQGGSETPSAIYRRLRSDMLTAEREMFVRLRDERRIDDEVLRRMMAELDFEEAILER
ncbi:Na+/H+ antiporter [Nonomuraea sp. NBC_01738]|uniref:Na+/H+ antiporter n=1 Tax=Nonomuraea sp. NBC_01738 TaxID=2976003 RepID=UPI002E0E7A11|nr:Na+/H+ antiporter [Nonomuraea sp. NBC_01738]